MPARLLLLIYLPLPGLRSTRSPTLLCTGPDLDHLAHFLSASVCLLYLFYLCTCTWSHLPLHLPLRPHLRLHLRAFVCCRSGPNLAATLFPGLRTSNLGLYLPLTTRSLVQSPTRSLACSPTHPKLTGAVSRFSHPRDPQAKTNLRKEHIRERISLRRKKRKKKTISPGSRSPTASFAPNTRLFLDLFRLSAERTVTSGTPAA